MSIYVELYPEQARALLALMSGKVGEITKAALPPAYSIAPSLVSTLLALLSGYAFGTSRNSRAGANQKIESGPGIDTNLVYATSIAFGIPENRAGQGEMWWQLPVRNTGSSVIQRAVAELWLRTNERFVLRWDITGGLATQSVDLEPNETHWIPLFFRRLNPLQNESNSNRYWCFFTADQFFVNAETVGYPALRDYEFQVRVRAENLSETRSPHMRIHIPPPNDDSTEFRITQR